MYIINKSDKFHVINMAESALKPWDVGGLVDGGAIVKQKVTATMSFTKKP